eukprot:CCRYP_019265-RA/>CCRYP_019265-RA protein AED:0.40 eAED:0.40 QI:0/-1/0/1/-1/1/1/0/290
MHLVIAVVILIGFIQRPSASAFVAIPQLAESRHKAFSSQRDDDVEGHDDASDFDPLLSPHAYPQGIDYGAVLSESREIADLSSATGRSFGFQSSEDQELTGVSSRMQSSFTLKTSALTPDEDFDPTLSPHLYPNGIAAGVVEEGDGQNGKLGVLLIDHGSKREASNEHLHNLAKIYQFNSNRNNYNMVVRGAHMEIATPSILTSLRNLITVDRVTKIVCVPYFLSPGRHATIDVPNLIAEAKAILDDEGVTTVGGNERIEVIVSDALGTHTESMLGAVDTLIDMALDKQM